MELDNIINELVDKRFEEMVRDVVTDAITGRSSGNGLHHKLDIYIRKIMDKVIQSKADRIKEILSKALDMAVIDGAVKPTFQWKCDFNISSWDLEKLLEKAEKQKSIIEGEVS